MAVTSSSMRLKLSSLPSCSRRRSPAAGLARYRSRDSPGVRLPSPVRPCDRRNCASTDWSPEGNTDASIARPKERSRSIVVVVSGIELSAIEVVKTHDAAKPGEPAGIDVQADASYANVNHVEREG